MNRARLKSIHFEVEVLKRCKNKFFAIVLFIQLESKRFRREQGDFKVKLKGGLKRC